ncbi:MAG: hypothetical protein DMG13_04680 [Acidobacteria bacterium]|nr:MAG: hypothetical protein DMG13_04680 [Acidobacteriota bacterium]
MDMYSFLSVWVRESPSLWAFPFILICHTVGMGFLVGTNVAMDLRILGFAPRVPLSLFQKFFPVMQLAFCVNAVSGILLLIAYPTKALTNPLFYIKLCLIAFALTQTRWIRDQVLRNPAVDVKPVLGKGRVLAGTSLAVWAGAVTAGRLLAYTYTHLMSGE